MRKFLSTRAAASSLLCTMIAGIAAGLPIAVGHAAASSHREAPLIGADPAAGFAAPSWDTVTSAPALSSTIMGSLSDPTTMAYCLSPMVYTRCSCAKAESGGATKRAMPSAGSGE